MTPTVAVLAVGVVLGVAVWLRERRSVLAVIDSLPPIPASDYEPFVAPGIDEATIDRERAYIAEALEFAADRLAPQATPADISRTARPAGRVARVLSRPVTRLWDSEADGLGLDLTLSHLEDDLWLRLGYDFDFDPDTPFAELVEALATADEETA